MRRELLVRIRISRPVARALVVGFILGFPCSTLTPSVTQTFTLDSSVPDARAQFVQLRSSGQTSLGLEGQNITMSGNQDCRMLPPGAQWRTNPPSGCTGTLRRVSLIAPTQLNQAASDFNDIVSGAQSAAKVYVQGDIWANQLCWNDGTCISEWEPEGGELVARTCDKNGANCGNSCLPGPPIDYNSCGASQALTSTMHLQYTISNTTGTGQVWRLYFGVSGVDGGGCPVGPCEVALGGGDSVPYQAACSGQSIPPCQPIQKLAANTYGSAFPPPAPADSAIYRPGGADTTNWGLLTNNSTYQVKYKCAYGYWGQNAVIDCFLGFPKAHNYNFYFDARKFP